MNGVETTPRAPGDVPQIGLPTSESIFAGWLDLTEEETASYNKLWE